VSLPEGLVTLAQRSMGAPCPWYRGRDQARVILTVSAGRIGGVG
jgi:hypothetical protein